MSLLSISNVFPSAKGVEDSDDVKDLVSALLQLTVQTGDGK